MNHVSFDAEYESLCHYYGKPVNKAQMANWYNEFSGVYDSVLIKAIDAVKHNGNNLTFPSPNIIWKAIHEVRAGQWQRKKAEEQSTSREFWRTENKSGCGLSALTLIKALNDHKLTIGQLVEQMYQEDEVYPRAGWKENADALNAFQDYYHEPDADKRRIKKYEMERLDGICDGIK